MAVRSERLFSVSCPSGATTTLVTAGSGRTVLVKYVTAQNTSAGAQAPGWSVRPSGSGTEYFWKNNSIVGAGTDREHVWIVLMPGDSLRLTVAGGAAVLAQGFGADLIGVGT